MELYLNDIQVDLDDRVPFPLTYQVSDIRDISKRKGSTSKTIKLPGTQRNVKLMSGVFVVSASDSTSGNSSAFDNFDPTAKATARYYERGILQFEGVCQLRDCIKNNGEWSFEIVLFQESIDIFKLLQNYKINELGWSEYNHTLNKTNQANSWSGSIIKNGSSYSNITSTNWNGEGYYYGLIDYGFDRPAEGTFRVEDIAPQLFIKEIVDKMFEKIDVTYDSNFFETQRFKKLLLAYEGGEFPNVGSGVSTANSIETDWLTDGSGNVLDIDQVLEYNSNLNTWSPFVFSSTINRIDYVNNTATEDGAVNLIQSDDPFKFVAQEPGLYSLTFAGTVQADLDFTVTGGSGSYDVFWQRLARVEIKKNGVPYQQEVLYSNTISNGTSLTNTVSVTGTLAFELDLEPSDIIEVKLYTQNSHTFKDTGGTPTEVSSRITVSPTISVDVSLEEVSITEGSTVNIKQFLPEKMTCAELLKGLVTKFNLIVRADENDPKKLEIEPLDDFYQGTRDAFGNDITDDWTEIVDRSKEWRVTPTINFADKEYLFSFQDDKDYWNDRYTNDINEQYGSKLRVSSSEFATKTNEQKLPFSQKPVVNIPTTDLILPRAFQVKTDQGGLSTMKPKKGKAFIVQLLNADAGTLRAGAWTHRSTTPSVSDTARSKYPYVGHIDDPDTPTFDLLFNVPDYVFYELSGGQDYTTNNLYTYHEKSINELIDRHGKMLTCYVKLDANRINTLNFKKLIRIDGVVYKLNKIENYESGNEDPTKVELIKIIEGNNVQTYTSVDGKKDKYIIDVVNIDVDKVEDGVATKSLGVNSDGNMVKTNVDVGEVLYKARLVQSGTSAPVVTEYINNTGLTVNSSYSSVGNYALIGFAGSGVLEGNIELSMSNGLSSGDSVELKVDSGYNVILITTVDNNGTLKNDALKGDSSNYNHCILTLKKYT